MLSYVLVLVMWPKWLHKHLQVTKTYSAGKNFIYRFLDFIKDVNFIYRKYFTDFEDDDFNCTGKFCYQYGNFQNTEAATGGVLKTQIKVSQNSREKTYVRISFLVKLEGLDLFKKKSPTQVFSCEIC